jgi:dephospho-CoA kinase
MARRKSRILKVGITGGIGSGKSLVCSLFEKDGVPVLYADAIAREISDGDEKIRKAIIRLLGKESYDADGSLDRPYVAEKIFGNKSLHQKLNRIVHPEVTREITRRLDELGKAGQPIALVEAALIFEAGLNKHLDYVVVVEAEEATRIGRLMDRDRTTEEQIRRRMNSQWNSEEKIKRADFVLYNNGTKEELTQRVELLRNVLAAMSAKQ